MSKIDLFQYAEEISRKCGNSFGDIPSIMCSLMEEIGELSTEVNIHIGKKKRNPGPDGIVGEGIDAIICILDIIRVVKGELNEEELLEIFKTKLDKWHRNCV